MDELKAISFVEQAGDSQWICQKKDDPFYGQTGRFEVLEDLNCCAPTQNVLFAFVNPERRKVMDASTLLEFARQCDKL